MKHREPITDLERAELRRLYLAASQGTRKAQTVPQTSEHRLMADTGPGRELLLGFINHAEDAALAAAARNALPRLFAKIDELRDARRVPGRIPILGSVG